MSKPRYFHVWAKYHDTPEDLIDHLHAGGGAVKKVVLFEAMEPGSLTGSAEIEISNEEGE